MVNFKNYLLTDVFDADTDPEPSSNKSMIDLNINCLPCIAETSINELEKKSFLDPDGSIENNDLVDSISFNLSTTNTYRLHSSPIPKETYNIELKDSLFQKKRSK